MRRPIIQTFFGFFSLFLFLATTIRQGEKKSQDSSKKEEVKLSLLADDMILYIENPKDATRKLLKLNEFGKTAGYKISYTEIICIPIH